MIPQPSAGLLVGAAVNADLGAGDEDAVVGGERRHDSGHCLRRPVAPLNMGVSVTNRLQSVFPGYQRGEVLGHTAGADVHRATNDLSAYS